MNFIPYFSTRVNTDELSIFSNSDNSISIYFILLKRESILNCKFYSLQKNNGINDLEDYSISFSLSTNQIAMKMKVTFINGEQVNQYTQMSTRVAKPVIKDDTAIITVAANTFGLKVK